MIENSMTKEELVKMKEFCINMEKKETNNEKWFNGLFYVAYFLVCLSFVTGNINNSFSIAIVFLSWSLSIYFKAVYDQKRKKIKKFHADVIFELDQMIASLDSEE